MRVVEKRSREFLTARSSGCTFRKRVATEIPASRRRDAANERTARAMCRVIRLELLPCAPPELLPFPRAFSSLRAKPDFSLPPP